ncbi:MAG: hypothetical protein JW996_06480 [Candidatus Cloacimonetes bacterium]|nr:hypothetical protein [Candidatus Cloacimonadota bacterium]
MPKNFWEIIINNGWEKYFFSESDLPEQEVEILIIRTKTRFSQKMLDHYPRLKMIIRAGSGYDNIDIDAVRKKDVIVCSTPEANKTAAFEHTISLIMALLKRHNQAQRAISDSTWKDNLQPCWEFSEIRALIVGLGRIGTMVAETLQILGAQVRGVDPYLNDDEMLAKGVRKIDYQQGLCWCNLISFHCPLTLETVGYFNSASLKSLNDPVWLINAARGGIISKEIYQDPLYDKYILGIGLDVYEKEPCSISDLPQKQNIIYTPHIAAFTRPARMKLVTETLKTWESYVFHNEVYGEIDYRFTYK